MDSFEKERYADEIKEKIKGLVLPPDKLEALAARLMLRALPLEESLKDASCENDVNNPVLSEKSKELKCQKLLICLTVSSANCYYALTNPHDDKNWQLSDIVFIPDAFFSFYPRNNCPPPMHGIYGVAYWSAGGHTVFAAAIAAETACEAYSSICRPGFVSAIPSGVIAPGYPSGKYNPPAYAFDADAKTFTEAFANDLAISTSLSALELLNSPLWCTWQEISIEGIKNKSAGIKKIQPLIARPPERWQQQLVRFKETARSLNAGFEFWLDWYDDRIQGKPIDVELLKLWHSIPEELKTQSVAEINAYLKEIAQENANQPLCHYHGIFLSHTHADKPFVRELKSRLEAHGVKEIWLDEGEIQIGDSLTKKIEEGLKKTKYFGVVLSPRSIKSPWVERELEIAISREISTGDVCVLPLLYEKCDLPEFLKGKMYADFTSPTEYDESLGKLLRRLKFK